MPPEVVKEDYVGKIMGRNVANRLIIFWHTKDVCLCFVCLRVVLMFAVSGESVSILLLKRHLASDSSYKMTQLDSLLFASRRIKDILNLFFYWLRTHVSAARPESAPI